MRCFLLFSFFLSAIIPVLAQNEQNNFLITTAGDTLRGRLKEIGKHGNVIRLYRPGLAPAEFSAGEIILYGSKIGVMKVSRKVGSSGAQQFLVPLVTGHLSLFSGENDKQENRFYLQSIDSSRVIEISPVTAQLTYARQMPDCSTLAFGSDKIQNHYPYTIVGISDLVMDYNRCRWPQQTTQLVRRDKGLRTTFGLKAGFNVSSFDLSPAPYYGAHTEATGFQAGGLLNIASRTHLSVQLEAVYILLRSAYGLTSPTSITSAAHIHYSQVQVPLLLRYTAGHGTLRPYVNAGPNAAIIFGNTSSLIYPGANIIYESPIELSKLGLGATVGGGLAINRPKLPVFNVEVRFDKMVDNNAFIFYTPTHTSLRVDFGLVF